MQTSDISDKYMVTSDGRVFSKHNANPLFGGWLKPKIDDKGYYCFDLCHDGVCKRHKAHRLVAKHFIPNPKSKPCVNHKDGDKKNNNVDNLEWCTIGENCRHAWKNGLMEGTVRASRKRYLIPENKERNIARLKKANFGRHKPNCKNYWRDPKTKKWKVLIRHENTKYRSPSLVTEREAIEFRDNLKSQLGIN